MAAFWGFLFALLCIAMLVVGLVAGWAMRVYYVENQKWKEKRPVNYTTDYKPSYKPDGPVQITRKEYEKIQFSVPAKNFRFYTYDQTDKAFIEEEAYEAFRNNNIELVDMPDVMDKERYYYDAGKDMIYRVSFINKPSKETDTGYSVINFGTPKFIGRGEFYASATGKNSSFLRYDPKSEDFIQENGVHMYCQEAIRDELEHRFLADDAVYIHWSGDNTYSRVIMKEDTADEGADNTTSGD